MERYVIHGCMQDDGGHVERVPDDRAQFWTLYTCVPVGRYTEEYAVLDFPSRAAAEAYERAHGAGEDAPR